MEIYFALNFLKSKGLVLEYWTCGEVGVDEGVRPGLEFMLCLREAGAREGGIGGREGGGKGKTFTRYLGQEVEMRVCGERGWEDGWNLAMCLY